MKSLAVASGDLSLQAAPGFERPRWKKGRLSSRTSRTVVFPAIHTTPFQACPTSFLGSYGSSKYLFSSSVSTTSNAPTFHSEMSHRFPNSEPRRKNTELTYSILEIIELCGANNGGDDTGSTQDPCNGNLGHTRALLLSNFFNTLDYGIRGPAFQIRNEPG